VLLLLAGAAVGDRWGLSTLVEEHQGAGVEVEAVQVGSELLETFIEGVVRSFPTHLELGGVPLDASLG